MCKFMVESPAINMEIKFVYFWEFGWSMLHNWMFSLKLPLPLSPPCFSHSLSLGITSCQVRPAFDLQLQGNLKHVNSVIRQYTFHRRKSCLHPWLSSCGHTQTEPAESLLHHQEDGKKMPPIRQLRYHQ